MPKTYENFGDHFKAERRKIQTSGILDALIEYAEGRRDMSSSQVSAALGLLKKALPDLSTLSLADGDLAAPGKDNAGGAGETAIEIRIVDPQR